MAQVGAKSLNLSDQEEPTYSREGINWAKLLGACSSDKIAKIPINLDAKRKLYFSLVSKNGLLIQY